MDREERPSSLSRRSVLAAGALSPFLLSLVSPSIAQGAASETWEQWTARMQQHSSARRPVNDPGYSRNGECTHLWRDYVMKVVGASWGAGNSGSYAYQLWTAFESDAEAKAVFDRVPLSSGGRRGDGVIWSSSFNPPAGHVAVLVDDLGDSLRVWTQNQYGNRFPEIRTFAKSSTVYGFLRPKNFNPAPPQPIVLEDDMTVIANTQTNMWALVGLRFFKGIPSGQGNAALKLCKQTGPVAVSDAEWNAIQSLVS